MTTIAPADAWTRAELEAAERRRCRALIEGDAATLDDLYDDTLVHVHAPGLVHTKAQLLEHVATRQAYLDIQRGPLDLRIVGDVAVMVGPIVNRLRTAAGGERTMPGVVTEVFRRCDDGAWRLITFQMTPYGDQDWPALPSELTAHAPEHNQTEELTQP